MGATSSSLFMVISTFLAGSAAWKLVHKLGAFAFIPLGIADNSVIPTFGSMDVLVIVLAAANAEFWWYYALMAALGALIGGFVSYHISARGGQEALEKKLKPERAKKVYRTFEKYGFWAVFFGGIAPPPMPIFPFLATAGAMKYPRPKFLLALGSARLLRFAIIAWLASHYGKHIFGFLGKYYKPALWTLIVLGVAGGIAALIWYKKFRKKEKRQEAAGVPEQKVA